MLSEIHIAPFGRLTQASLGELILREWPRAVPSLPGRMQHLESPVQQEGEF